MPKAVTSILGLAAVAPIVGLILVAFVVPIIVPEFEQIKGPLSSESLRLIFGILGLAIMVLFIVMTFTSQAVPSEKRGLWVAVLLFGNFVVLPFFWFWYVRPYSRERA